MPKPSKEPKPLKDSGEKARFEVLLEEVRAQQKLILERVNGLPERLDRVEFRLGRIEQDNNGFRVAIISNSTELQRLQHDVQKLQHEVAKLTERFEIHQKEHAT